MYKAIFLIGLRGSVLFALGIGLYTYATQHMKAMEAYQRAIELKLPLECANSHSDQELLKHANGFGNIDISKFHCADRVFWASMEEIRNPDRAFNDILKFHRYEDYVNADIIGSAVAFYFILSTFAVALFAACLASIQWVVGPKLSGAISEAVVGASEKWVAPIVTGAIATLIGGVLITFFSS